MGAQVRYVEHDAEGNITHVAEVFIPGAPVPPDETAAARNQREARDAARVSETERQMREQMVAAGALVVPDNAPLPSGSTHRVAGGTLRPLTTAELEARRRAAGAAAPRPTP